MKKELMAGIALLALIIGILYGYYYGNGPNDVTNKNITSYDECVAAGYPVMESYPAKCSVNGETFVQDIGNELALSNLIVVDNPRPNQVVESPLTIFGRARGHWFFEASAPVKILDNAGNLLSESFIQARGEWMTENFVDFEGEITFNSAGATKGILVLQNDNPSGLPENANELRIPIRFE